MMADYCWSLARHKPQTSRKRKVLKRQFACYRLFCFGNYSDRVFR